MKKFRFIFLITVISLIWSTVFYSNVTLAQEATVPEDPAQLPIDNTAEAENLLALHQAGFVNQKINVTFGSRYVYTPYLKNIGVNFDISKTLEQINASLGEGDLVQTTQNLIDSNQVPYVITVNNAYFTRYFNLVTRSHLPKAKNAWLRVVRGKVRLIHQVNGKRAKISDLETAVTNALTNHEALNFVLAWESYEPSITDAETEGARLTTLSWLTQTVKVRVKYNHHMRRKKHNRNYYANRYVIGSWVYYVNENGTLSPRLSRKRINRWLKRVARRAYVKPTNRLVAFRNHHRVVVKSGYAGQRIIVTGLYKTIVANIKAETTTYLPIRTKSVKPRNIYVGSVIPGRFHGKYIDISLSQQKMYVFRGYRLLHIFMISSGRPGLSTPTGRFRIRDKRLSNACRPSSEYYSCIMPYTMHFTSAGHAIHALPIINGRQEGQWHLGHRVSHGCVRVARSNAIYLYHWAYIGMPVIIH